MDVIFVDGHTEKQMLPVVEYQDKTIVFAADLIPTVGHIPLVYVPSYDTRPLYWKKRGFSKRMWRMNIYYF